MRKRQDRVKRVERIAVDVQALFMEIAAEYHYGTETYPLARKVRVALADTFYQLETIREHLLALKYAEWRAAKEEAARGGRVREGGGPGMSKRHTMREALEQAAGDGLFVADNAGCIFDPQDVIVEASEEELNRRVVTTLGEIRFLDIYGYQFSGEPAWTLMTAEEARIAEGRGR